MARSVGEPRRMAMSGKHSLMMARADDRNDGTTGRGTRRDAIGKTRRFNKLKTQTRENSETIGGDTEQRNRRKEGRAKWEEEYV